MTKTREELLLYVSRLETIIDCLPFDVWMKDQDGNYLVVNQNISDQTGYSKESIIGKNDYDLYDRPIADLFTAGDRATIEGKGKDPYILKLESETLEEYKRSLYDENGAFIGTTGFSRDITRKEQIQEELTRSEERFRTIFEEAPIGTGIFDIRTGKAVQINARYAEILGRTKEEILALDWTEYTHPEDVKENLHQIELMAEKRIEGFSLNKRFVKPGGRKYLGEYDGLSFSFLEGSGEFSSLHD